MKTLISFFARQNNEVSIENFENFALSQGLMNIVRGGTGADEDPDRNDPPDNPSENPPVWLPEI